MEENWKEPGGSPFKLKWAVGVNSEVPIVNLTTETRFLLAYASSHAVLLLDYASQDSTSLLGHRNSVRSLSSSSDGKWLLSADFDEDCVCVVWDTETRVPVCSLFNPHGRNSLAAVQLSPDAKYIVTVGNERLQKVYFWQWTRASEEPEATSELSQTTDRVKKISFREENPTEFLLTLSHSVIFASWSNSKTLDTLTPTVTKKNTRTVENLNDSCYVSMTNLATSVTRAGSVLVWSEVDETSKGKRKRGCKRRLLKAVPLRKGCLTTVESIKGIIAIGNNAGQLFFYDNQLKLLYWCQNLDSQAIVSLSFDRKSNFKSPEVPQSVSTISQSSEDSLNLLSEEYSFYSELGTEEDESVTKDNEKKNISELQEEEEPEKRFSNAKNDSLENKKVLSASAVTLNFDYQPNCDKGITEPTDCTLKASSFEIPNFLITSISGKVSRVDVSNLKCKTVLRSTEGSIKAIATCPKSEYLVTGSSLGLLCLYKYSTRKLMVSKMTPKLPNFFKMLSSEEGKLDISYVTCPQVHESLVGVSSLKFSPARDGVLACGLESGVIWLLNPQTLDPLDPKPFKHSSCKILDLLFSNCGEYLAYSDDAFTVGLFRRASDSSKPLFNFLGKHHSHSKPVREIIFANPELGKSVLRLFSIGEDKNLVEYDLENTGSYPEPGLKIIVRERIESTAVPLCMTSYPDFEAESLLIIANSEYKFRLVNDQIKTIRATFLGPTFGEPVRKMLITPKRKKNNKRGYMVIATRTEIGLMVLPFDGNPRKILAMIGHPKKVTSMAVSDCGEYLFTVGENSGFLAWKINYSALDSYERLGGPGLSPFYSLIEGGEQGWLSNEMRDLFCYAQILQQGEDTTESRELRNEVSIRQIPNLMRAVGFYPSNSQLEDMMEEVSYKEYAKTGQLLEDISFEDFVKLYINHRPAFGITKEDLEDAFQALSGRKNAKESAFLTANQFVQVLIGRGPSKRAREASSIDEFYGEPLSLEEAHACLRRLVSQDEDSASLSSSVNSINLSFDFLPPVITSESFTEEILGVDVDSVLDRVDSPNEGEKNIR